MLFPYGHCLKGGGRGGDVMACQDGLEYFFPTFAHLTEGRGGGSTAIETTHFKKGLPN